MLEGLYYNGGIDSRYKNASRSIGGCKIVIKKKFVYNFLHTRAQKLPLLVQYFIVLKLNIYNI